MRGSNKYRNFTIHWADVDHIAIVNVVDGPHAACAFHPLGSANFDHKIRICATVTGNIFADLATMSGGARALIAFCLSLRGRDFIPPLEAREILSDQYNSKISTAKTGLDESKQSVTGMAIIGKNKVTLFEESRHFLEFLRRRPPDRLETSHVQNLLERFSDLNWEDVFGSAAFQAAAIPAIERELVGILCRAEFGFPTKFIVTISSNASNFIDKLPSLVQYGKDIKASFMLNVSITTFGPDRSFALIDCSAPWGIDVDLADISELET